MVQVEMKVNRLIQEKVFERCKSTRKKLRADPWKDEKLRLLEEAHGEHPRDWEKIAEMVQMRKANQVRSRRMEEEFHYYPI
jgi:hypothetical protein